MRLWTYQRDNFSIIADRVDPALSRNVQKYRQQYERLWQILETDQIIWCGTDSEWWPKAGYAAWPLEIPTTAFLRIVDSMVWNGLLGERGCPTKLHDQLLDEETALTDDAEEAYANVERRKEFLWNPQVDPWEALFIDDPTDFRAEVLLKCPIATQWVLSTTADSLATGR
jgi:hypothetical protein